MKHSFGLLKPDCLERELVEKALGLIENRGLKVVFIKKYRFSIEDVYFLYNHCIGKEFFGNMINFFTSNDSILYVVKTNNEEINVFKLLNSVVGDTNPINAKPNTLRNLGESISRNIAHSSSNEETFIREVCYFLTAEERIKIGLNI